MGRIISRPRGKTTRKPSLRLRPCCVQKIARRGTPCRRNRAGSATRCGNSPSAPPLRRVHIHVPLQEEDTVGQLLAVTHFGDGNHPHLFGKILVTGIFEMDMEIHVLERGGNLFSQSIVQQIDTFLVLVRNFDLFHNNKGFVPISAKPVPERNKADRKNGPKRSRFGSAPCLARHHEIRHINATRAPPGQRLPLRSKPQTATSRPVVRTRP